MNLHIISQKFTNFCGIRSWSFQNICNEIGWPIGPVFCATLHAAPKTLRTKQGAKSIKRETEMLRLNPVPLYMYIFYDLENA